MCWQKDTTAAATAANLGFEARQWIIIARPNPVGTFGFCGLLKHAFGFCDDYNKFRYGIKQSLLLSMQADINSIYHDSCSQWPAHSYQTFVDDASHYSSSRM